MTREVPTIEWLGCATFRVRLQGLTLFFDSYLDEHRAPGANRVGLRADEVDDADFVFVSHAHFDHMLGADVIAKNTGATIAGSFEVARILAANGVANEQILPLSGGEPIECGHDVRVRPFPSLHSCLFAEGTRDSGHECLGDLGISAQERRRRTAELMGLAPQLGEEIAAWSEVISPRSSIYDGGQFAYLVESPDGSILVSSSAGYWSGVIQQLRPDLAVLAASGRPNVDGEPYQGSLASFFLSEVEAMRPSSIILSHHDALMPPLLTETDTGELRRVLKNETSDATVIDLEYSQPVPILR